MIRKISKQSWKNFWNKFPGTNLSRKQENSLLPEKVYNITSRRLKTLEVSDAAFIKVKKYFEKYKEKPHLQFYKYCQVFCLYPEIIMKWTNTKNSTDAFVKFLKLIKDNRRKSEIRRDELLLLYKLIRKKREILEYKAKTKKKINKSTFSKQEFSQLFSLGDKLSNYSCSIFNFDGFMVFGVSKNKGESKVFQVAKFVLIKKTKGEIIIKIAVDNNYEKEKVLSHLSKKLSISITSRVQTVRFSKLNNFLKSGESKHFRIVNAILIDNDISITFRPLYSRDSNITQQNKIYEKIISGKESYKKIARIRLVLLSDVGHTVKPFYISLFDSDNDGSVGSITIRLDGRGLNINSREEISTFFKQDFGIILDRPVRYKINILETYRRFFSNAPKRRFGSDELVSPQVLEIENKLSIEKLLPLPDSKKENYKYCSTNNCSNRNIPFWTTDKVCSSCKNDLNIGRYSLEYKIILEENIRDFFYRIFSKNGYRCLKLSRQLAKRGIFPLEVRKKEESICLIPVTKKLNTKQIELLNYKYPNGILITSMENIKDLEMSGVTIAKDLHVIIHNLLENNPKKMIEKLFNEVASEQTSRYITLSKNSLKRISNINNYSKLGSFGPDFFETDINMLISYIFRNSIWLGANSKGKKLPDSISAFPVDNKKRGCFIIDAKFSSGIDFDMDKVAKNKVYVRWGRNSESINKFGKLKGFTFISNKMPKKSFKEKLVKVIGKFHIMGSSLNTKQLILLYKFYRKHEDEFNRNYRKRNTFLDFMEDIFTKPKSYNSEDKIVVWENKEFSKLLKSCEKALLGSTRILN